MNLENILKNTVIQISYKILLSKCTGIPIEPKFSIYTCGIFKRFNKNKSLKKKILTKIVNYDKFFSLENK